MLELTTKRGYILALGLSVLPLIVYRLEHSRHALERAVARCGQERGASTCLQNIPGSRSPLSAIARRPASMSPSIGYGASGIQALPHAVAGVRLAQRSLAGVALRTLRTPYARA